MDEVLAGGARGAWHIRFRDRYRLQHAHTLAWLRRVKQETGVTPSGDAVAPGGLPVGPQRTGGAAMTVVCCHTGRPLAVTGRCLGGHLCATILPQLVRVS